MDTLTLFTIILAIVSIVVSVVSLILSILFYVWSKKSNDDVQKSSIHIDHNTKEIQKLFDRFYSDTFSMMRGAFLAMQNRVLENENTDSDIAKAPSLAEESVKEKRKSTPSSKQSL